ncbi:MAG: hypothetical protein AAF411_10195 [Myxococcota bacterium]
MRSTLQRAFFALLAVLATVSSARADELSDFSEAQATYDRGAYAEAVRLFEALVGGEVPTIRNEILIVESRKYLGAAYLFQDRRPDAERQFELLLRESPDYALDPLAFSAAIQETFAAVRERLEGEAAQREAERERLERERREREMRDLVRQQERIAQLESLARQETVEERSSRWLATLPFGTGQFQNGHRSLGLALLTTQVFLASASTITFFYHRFLINESNDGADVPESLERGVRITNQITTGAFAAVAVAGVIDAHVRFEPIRRTTRERPLPPELEPDAVAEQPTLHLQLGAGYAGFRLNF